MMTKSNKFKVGDTIIFRPYQHLNTVGPWDGPAKIVGEVAPEPYTPHGWRVTWKGKQMFIFESDYEIELA